MPCQSDGVNMRLAKACFSGEYGSLTGSTVSHQGILYDENLSLSL